MNCTAITHVDAFAALRHEWKALAGDIPFRQFDWLFTWWSHYETSRRQLLLLVVRDEAERVIGIAPCYLQENLAVGREIRLLGDGEVCSDHINILCDSQNADFVCTTIAQWLVTNRDRWDSLRFDALDSREIATQCIASSIDEQGIDCQTRPYGRFWSISLPTTWDDFLAMQSKSHRKQLRQSDRRVLQSDRVRWHSVTQVDELDFAWPILVDLHQRRRISLGQPGCFASERFEAFHHEIAQKLLAMGQLRLSWTELDGIPVAAEYHFAGGDTTYAYQGGVDPNRLNEEPGRLSLISSIQASIAEGSTAFDLMRGDEPYKPHWRAEPHETVSLHAVSPKRSAILRSAAIATAVNVGRWLKNGLAQGEHTEGKGK